MKNLFIAFFTLIISLAVMETFLTFTEIGMPPPIKADRELGRAFIPDAKHKLIEEGFYLGKINKYGYLGPAYPPENDDASLRIALYGDSFVEAFQHFETHSLRSVLERELNDALGDSVEVLNFGRGGLDFRNEYLFYKYYDSHFRVDLSLMFISEGDLASEGDKNYPRLTFNTDNELCIDTSFVKTAPYRLRNEYPEIFRSPSVNLITKSIQLVQNDLWEDKIFEKLNFFHTGKNTDSKEDISGYTQKPDNNLETINFRLIDSLASYNHAGHRIFMVFRTRVDEKYIQACEAKGLKVVKLFNFLEELNNKGEKTNYFKATHKYGHWNNLAHKIIGKHLKNEILKSLNYNDDNFY